MKTRNAYQKLGKTVILTLLALILMVSSNYSNYLAIAQTPNSPDIEPTAEPTESPTGESTEEPTVEPTVESTIDLAAEPTKQPTGEPSQESTIELTTEPTEQPIGEPTGEPTQEPTLEPTLEPTTEPIEDIPLNGDVNGDGSVDILDLAFIASHYNSNDPEADINGNGVVDILDLALAASQYGQNEPTITPHPVESPVPQPTDTQLLEPVATPTDISSIETETFDLPVEAAAVGQCKGDGIYLYEHSNYQGRCLKFTSSYPDFTTLGFNNIASSIRLVGVYGVGRLFQVILYDKASYSGDFSPFIFDDSNFGNNRIDHDRATSLKILPNPIEPKYRELGAENGFLGKPVNGMQVTSDEIGRYIPFEHGYIYWSPQTGAHAIYGLIYKKWKDLGGEKSFLGYPVTDELPAANGGRYNGFQGGYIYWTNQTGARTVYGDIYLKWKELGGEGGVLGYPVTDEKDARTNGGRYGQFQGGYIYWTRQTGAHAVYGFIYKKWKDLGGERGSFGYPVTDELTAADGNGRYNNFERGAIYWKVWANEAQEIYGPEIFSKWQSLGGVQGKLGYPVKVENKGFLTHFERGAIYFVSYTNRNGRVTKSYAILDDIYFKWKELGGMNSFLSYPLGDEQSGPNSYRRQNFDGGFIEWTPGTGSQAKRYPPQPTPTPKPTRTPTPTPTPDGVWWKVTCRCNNSFVQRDVNVRACIHPAAPANGANLICAFLANQFAGTRCEAIAYEGLGGSMCYPNGSFTIIP